MTAHSNLQNDIIMYLEAQGHYAANVIEASKAGTPDIVACIYGFFAGIEVKVGRDTPSALQTAKLKRIMKSGGFAIIARSLEDVTKLEEQIYKEFSK